MVTSVPCVRVPCTFTPCNPEPCCSVPFWKMPLNDVPLLPLSECGAEVTTRTSGRGKCQRQGCNRGYHERLHLIPPQLRSRPGVVSVAPILNLVQRLSATGRFR